MAKILIKRNAGQLWPVAVIDALKGMNFPTLCGCRVKFNDREFIISSNSRGQADAFRMIREDMTQEQTAKLGYIWLKYGGYDYTLNFRNTISVIDCGPGRSYFVSE